MGGNTQCGVATIDIAAPPHQAIVNINHKSAPHVRTQAQPLSRRRACKPGTASVTNSLSEPKSVCAPAPVSVSVLVLDPEGFRNNRNVPPARQNVTQRHQLPAQDPVPIPANIHLQLPNRIVIFHRDFFKADQARPDVETPRWLDSKACQVMGMSRDTFYRY
jgi:hypothetical protein